jgi:hypothetical protein
MTESTFLANSETYVKSAQKICGDRTASTLGRNDGKTNVVHRYRGSDLIKNLRNRRTDMTEMIVGGT